jgi:tyrosine decarboxylase/aspartate 1-decarboxylase
MGLSTIPSGALLFRSPFSWIPQGKTLRILQQSLNLLSRVLAVELQPLPLIAVMKYLGREGYRKNVQYCMQLTAKLVKEARKLGFEPLIEPVMNVVALRVPNPDFLREQLLNKFSWNVSITRNPRSLRLVLMPHNTAHDIEEFLQDLRKITADL